MRVLVAEDEEVMADALARGLRRAGYAADVAMDGATALELATLNPYDVVLLDRDLPVVHGDDVCRALLASGSSARILMLTAAGGLQEKVDGFGLGADDYLAKPFAFAELLARVQALARRTAPAQQPVLVAAGLRVDVARRAVTRDELPVDLTLKEYGVLVELVRAAGAVVSAEELLARVWDENADPFTNAVRVTMVGLRRKLGDPPLVETLRGAGYRVIA
ncbi:two-component system response regulator [Cellulomonas sp. Root485]|uniref:response regulator transcription factor n=1 Tax=Cellulomonas sp. Root485 TaxID=1736546 RepID=UPI0007012A3B|nr:response regulator transcription factor [Cellulomonas sp. Root485]KQY24968.1 two-component system response regulator [Cellulomonas sp. Root485]